MSEIPKLRTMTVLPLVSLKDVTNSIRSSLSERV